jgi:uncharacterized membrane protein (DUF373 family)
MKPDQSWRASLFRETRGRWKVMGAYERFEQVVAITLSLIVAAVILIALVQLVMQIVPLMLRGLDILEPEVFGSLFGMILTLLIALEFGHTIVRVAVRQDNIVQVKTVILIALLALARKFIVLDPHADGAATIAALAGATLVLGAVYWLLRERDDRLGATRREERGA